ncbi:MAG: hypothetical protein U0V75_08525 [Ferruginibacter sp.]
MTFEVSRITNNDLDSLFKRPRVSHKISEYVLSYLDEKILKPNRILQSEKQIYWFTLSFSFSIPKPNRILYKSPFSTHTRIFIPHKGFRTFEGKKWAFLNVTADDIDQDIKPYDYALVVFDMFADYLIYNYKKLNKPALDLIRNEMNKLFIESILYPAPFEEQQYAMDEGKYGLKAIGPGERLEDSIIISPKEEYIKHYGF